MTWYRCIALTCFLIASISCASAPVKQRAVVGLQSVETALGAAQDFELANHTALGLDGLASQRIRSYCPPSALPTPLPATATTHQVVACLFAQAFTSQIASATALQAWQTGDPAPTMLNNLKGEVDAIFGIASGLSANTNQQTWLKNMQTVVDLMIEIFKSMKWTPTPAVPGGA